MADTEVKTEQYSEMDVVALAAQFIGAAPRLAHRLLMLVIRCHCEDCIVKIELPITRVTELPIPERAVAQHELRCDHR